MVSQAASSDDNRTLTLVSSASFALLLVLVLATPFVEMTGVLGEAQKVFRLYGYGLLGLLQVVLVTLRGGERSLRVFSTSVIPFLLWCGLSLVWSQHFDLSGKRVALLGLVYLGAFSGVNDLGVQRATLIVRVLLLGALLFNFVAALALPEIGSHPGQHALWRGFMGHKNIAGMLCAVTVIFFAFDCARVPVAARLAVVAGALVFLYQSWSKTALLGLPIALMTGAAIMLFDRRYRSVMGTGRNLLTVGSLVVFGLLFVGLVLATMQREFLLSLTEDTSILTTRGAIWRPMIQFYLDHPLLGSGYGAYWDPSVNLASPAGRIGGLWKNIDQGHNGYLDLLVQTGLPGLALALYAAFLRPMRQLAIMIEVRPERAALAFSLLVFILIENFSESSLFADDTLANAFLLIILALFHHLRLRLRPQREAKSRQPNARS